MCGKVADRADRLFGVVRRMWHDDHVVQTEEQVHRLPVPLLGRFLLDVVQAGVSDPALLEGQVQGDMRATFGVIPSKVSSLTTSSGPRGAAPGRGRRV